MLHPVMMVDIPCWHDRNQKNRWNLPCRLKAEGFAIRCVLAECPELGFFVQSSFLFFCCKAWWKRGDCSGIREPGVTAQICWHCKASVALTSIKKVFLKKTKKHHQKLKRFHFRQLHQNLFFFERFLNLPKSCPVVSFPGIPGLD